MPKIKLLAEAVHAENLDYETAVFLMKKASRSLAGKYLSFTINSSSGKGWKLLSMARGLREEFINHPEEFYNED